MLQLQIGFPTGRYCAASLADPRQPEWPPHPSRVYSALVAAAYAGGSTPSAAQRAALQKLEAAPAPALSFPDADLCGAPDSYVPVNDVKSRITPKNPTGVLLPNRQARQFPSAFLVGEPEVRLLWALEVSPQELQALDELAARMTHLGTSHSFVTARFLAVEDDMAPRLVPSPGGKDYLRVPLGGRLDELDRIATQGHGTLRRPQPLYESLVAYALASQPAEAVRRSAHEWVTLRLADAAWGADTAHTLARAARRAVMALLGDHAPAAVHGHDFDVPHLAWLPLPDVGHPHARGKIRGLGIALPPGLSEVDRAHALAGLARLQLLHLPDGQTARVTPVLDSTETPVVLRADTWRRASTHWSSVTPVVLDRPPKRPEPERIVAALVESLVTAGFPVPVAVRVTRTSDFEGAPTAFDIPTRLPRYHARVQFAEPVEGPVIAGRWKNFGIGLFRPTPEELRP